MMKYSKAKFSKITIQKDFLSEYLRNRKRTFYTLAGECVNNYIYLFGIDNNSICKIDEKTGNIDILSGDSESALCEEFLYVKSIAYEPFIYFIPYKTNKILKYDTNTGQKYYICFENDIMEYEPIICEEQLFLFPVGDSEQLICIDLKTDAISYVPTMYSLQLSQKTRSESSIFGNAVYADGYIYRGSYLNSHIQVFDVKAKRFEYIEISGFDRSIITVTYDGKYLWALSQIDGKLACWNPNIKSTVFVLDIAKISGKRNTQYAACAYYNDTLYIIEKNGTCILELKTKEDMLISYDCTEIAEFKLKMQNGQMFSESIRCNHKGSIYFFPFRANGVLVKEKNGNVYFYSTETMKMLSGKKEQQIQNECICTLNEFCNITTVSKIRENTIIKQNVGKNIINALCV